MSCSRTQHGGGRSRTPDLSLRSPTLYHWATALPGSSATGKIFVWCLSHFSLYIIHHIHHESYLIQNFFQSLIFICLVNFFLSLQVYLLSQFHPLTRITYHGRIQIGKCSIFKIHENSQIHTPLWIPNTVHSQQCRTKGFNCTSAVKHSGQTFRTILASCSGYIEESFTRYHGITSEQIPGLTSRLKNVCSPDKGPYRTGNWYTSHS